MVKLDADNVIFREERGSRGATYYYYSVDQVLRPISILGEEEFLGQSGGTRSVRVTTPKDQISDLETIYKLSTTNSGNFFARKKRLQITDQSIELEDIGRGFSDVRFERLGSEERWIKYYRKYVNEMVIKVKQLKENLGAATHFSGNRLAEVISDPEQALYTSLMFNSDNSRVQSLRQKVASVHEVYGVTLMIKALDAEMAQQSEPVLRFADAQEFAPTGILETSNGPLTVWYQFNLEPQSEVVIRGALSEGVRHVRPDIVLFEGKVKKASDIRSDLSNVRLVIDPKINITEQDIDQLRSYGQAFPEADLIAGCLDTKHSDHKIMNKLRRKGWAVVPLRPDRNGSFMTRIRENVVQ